MGKRLTPTVFNTVFDVYKKSVKGCWDCPNFEGVISTLNNSKKFEFVSGTEEIWTSKLVIEKVKDGINIDIVTNNALPFKTGLEKIKSEFEINMEKLGFTRG